MKYTYVLRKYRLATPQKTRYQAMLLWREMQKQGSVDEFLVDEFVITDKPKGWFKSFTHQLFG